MKDSMLKNFLVNIRVFFTINIKKSLNHIGEDKIHVNDILCKYQGEIEALQRKVLYLEILEYYDNNSCEANNFIEELSFLREFREFCNFPYPKKQILEPLSFGYDSVLNLPYVMHKEKKLYFPIEYSKEDTATKYLTFLQEERILENDDMAITPHQYQSSVVQVEKGDVLFDLGAAEGLFALDVIDKVSKVVIVENDPKWITALNATFSPYFDKVMIVNKLVSATDTESTISLTTLLKSIDYEAAFVKMDIEGAELPSIVAASDFLQKGKGIKFAVAAYHHQHDAEELEAQFSEMNYRTEFSNGYMLFNLYDTPRPPFFRKGIVRAKK